MDNDSIDTLLLRHYGPHSQTPDALEQRLINCVRQDALNQYQQEHTVTEVLRHRISRRRAMKLVAIGSGGVGLLVASLEALDATIFGRDTTQSAFS